MRPQYFREFFYPFSLAFSSFIFNPVRISLFWDLICQLACRCATDEDLGLILSPSYKFFELRIIKLFVVVHDKVAGDFERRNDVLSYKVFHLSFNVLMVASASNHFVK